VSLGPVGCKRQSACHGTDNIKANRLKRTNPDRSVNGASLSVDNKPRHSLAPGFNETGKWPAYELPRFSGAEIPLSGWKRSLCASGEYPAFGDQESAVLPDTLTEQISEFSGFACYETTFVLDNPKKLLLEIADAIGGVEVFMNGETAGIKLNLTHKIE
jgi:hypothetical protein